MAIHLPDAQASTPVGRDPGERLLDPHSFDDLVLFQMSRLVSVGGARVIRLCEGRFGISRREWRVLSLLGEQEGLLSSQLAGRVHLDRARTSRAITSLEAKGLVRRETRPGDRRQVAMHLTPAGWSLHAELFPIVQQINRDLLAELDVEAVQILGRALDRLQIRAELLNQQAVDIPKAQRRRGRG